MAVPQRLTIDLPIGGSAAAEIVVQRSRFWAEAHRVESEDAAREVLATIRHRDHDARHHCMAFAVGVEDEVRRSNDDGEPSGTAGRPILDQIVGRDLSDVIIVVSRWFGGILLGTGGLTRAYGDAAAEVLTMAGSRRRERWNLSRIRVPVATAGLAEHRLRQHGEVLDVEHGAQWVTFDLAHRHPIDERLDGQALDLEVLEPVWRDVSA